MMTESLLTHTSKAICLWHFRPERNKVKIFLRKDVLLPVFSRQQLAILAICIIVASCIYLLQLPFRQEIPQRPAASHPAEYSSSLPTPSPAGADALEPLPVYSEAAPNGLCRIVQFHPFRGPIDINTAPPEILEILPGIGRSTAEMIVMERTLRGPFIQTSDLMRVSGIGRSSLDRILPLISTGMDAP
jgi:competence ComEA-like helix-hairpin-helix protein